MPSRFSRLGYRLYTGEKSIDFVGRTVLWYAISGVIILAAVLGLTVRGLNLGIDFKGGTSYTVTVSGSATQSLADRLRDAVDGAGVAEAETPTVMTAGSHSIIIETKAIVEGSADDTKVEAAIAKTAGVSQDEISRDGVGASWGARVAEKALTGLIVFLILVVLFIWAYFREWKMSLAGLVALLHDVVIAVGVYALVGFEVTPATVTGFLTILGFLLYDTVVVFDKVRENTKDLRTTKKSYAEAANLALNQTLVRSVNTSVVALLPVAAILIIATVELGSSTLKDIALALFVGMLAGTYSSIFIATPLLVHLKQGEKEVVEAARRAKRANVDRYASVPAVQDDYEGVAVADNPVELAGSRGHASDLEPPVAPARGPVVDSGAAGRPQPRRQPKSKRQ